MNKKIKPESLVDRIINAPSFERLFVATGLGAILGFGGGVGGLIVYDYINADRVVTEYSQVLYEDAVVSDVVYSPSRHGSGSGIGPTMDFDGNMGLAITSTNVRIPEKYAVVFECEHGKFISEGTDTRHKDLWNKLKEGMEVEVSYREKFQATYGKDNDGDGERDLVSRELVGYDFIDAVPKE